MYLYFGIFFVFVLLFFCLNFWRRKQIIRRVCSMCMAEKCEILDELISPFGYSYVPDQDIFTSRTDAWQRDFGYCALYDRSAPYLNMVFDCLPVYFNYCGRTYLIEFWKGQYGINTGCEIGVYNTDRIVCEDELDHTLFNCVDNEDMPKLSFTLFRNNQTLAQMCSRHWWLTAFKMGCFSWPESLSMRIRITLHTQEMAESFVGGLLNAGYCRNEISVCCNTVTFAFIKPPCSPGCGLFRKLQIRIAQWVNRFWCRVYLFVTRPFVLSVDRILYLYYYLPFAFRKMLRIRRYRHTKKMPCRHNCRLKKQGGML